MIQMFRCKDTQALYEGQTPKRFQAIAAASSVSGSTASGSGCFKWTAKGPVDVEIIDYH
jgi:proteic killer suppression protein